MTYRDRVRALAKQMSAFLQALGEYAPFDPRWQGPGRWFDPFNDVALHIADRDKKRLKAAFPADRDVAFTEMRSGAREPYFVITVHPKLVPGLTDLAKAGSAARNRFEGVIRHEIAHCALLWEEAVLNAVGEDTDPHPEKMADALAARVWGDPIRYDSDDIQTIGPGVSPRPSRLPR